MAQPNNGGGMANLPPEERRRIGQKAADKRKKLGNGWPETIQKEGHAETYLDATDEWAKRIGLRRFT